MIFVGIDPGCSGAIAVIDEFGMIASIDRFSSVVTEGQIGCLIYDRLSTIEDKKLLAIEKVHAMPGQGVSSTFKFGRSYGEAYAAAIICRAMVQPVSPQRWQKDFGLLSYGGASKSEHKKSLKEFAAARWGRKFHSEEADAVLLAEWVRLYSLRAPTRSAIDTGLGQQ